jgi:hypothetical protein
MFRAVLKLILPDHFGQMMKVENIHFGPKVLGTSGKILMLKQNVSSFGIFMLQKKFRQIMKVELLFFHYLPKISGKMKKIQEA